MHHGLHMYQHYGLCQITAFTAIGMLTAMGIDIEVPYSIKQRMDLSAMREEGKVGPMSRLFIRNLDLSM